LKEIVSISLGPSDRDYEFETEFLGQDFHIRRIGTDGNLEKATDLLADWDKDADVMGLGHIKFPYEIGMESGKQKHARKLRAMTSRIRTPVVTGESLRKVGYEWSLRHIQFKFGGNYFNNARVLFLSGLVNYSMAKAMSEYTENLTFADPILENGISKFLNSLKEVEKYAGRIHEVLKWVPSKRISSSVVPLKVWNEYIMRKAMQKASIVVVPYYGFYEYLERYTLEELGGKIIITATAYDDRVQFLKDRGGECRD